MRISDWSSDVCSSDLRRPRPDAAGDRQRTRAGAPRSAVGAAADRGSANAGAIAAMGRSCGQRSDEAEDRIDVVVDVVQLAAVAAAVAVADAELPLPMQASRQLPARPRRPPGGRVHRTDWVRTRGYRRERFR